MTLYRLNYDAKQHPRVDISQDELMDKLPDGQRSLAPGKVRADYWQPLEGSLYYNPDNSEQASCPDLGEWLNALVLSAKAKDALEDSLTERGELLPIDVDGVTRYCFNILNFTDAIDPFNSCKEIFEGVEMGVEKIAFLAHEVDQLLIFKTDYDGYSYTYCTDKFKTLVESTGLSSGWQFLENLR